MVEEIRQPDREEIQPPDGHVEHVGVRHEQSDAGLRPILGVALGSIILGIIIAVALFVFLYRTQGYLTKVRQSSFPVASEQRQQLPPGPGAHPLNGGTRAGQHERLPPEPRLEQINVREGVAAARVADLYARDADILHSYGPTQEKGFVHIPIERAMTLLEGKLPVRKEPAPDGKRDQGLLDWGESNSGRLFRGNPR
jgi:hypothetical protein